MHGAIAPLPQYAFKRGAQLKKQRDNFTVCTARCYEYSLTEEHNSS